MEKHKIAMNSTLDAYKMALGQNDERVQKLRNEIEEKKKEIVEREEKWKLEEEGRNEANQLMNFNLSPILQKIGKF